MRKPPAVPADIDTPRDLDPIDEITRALSDADDRVYAVVREMQKRLRLLTEERDAARDLLRECLDISPADEPTLLEMVRDVVADVNYEYERAEKAEIERDAWREDLERSRCHVELKCEQLADMGAERDAMRAVVRAAKIYRTERRYADSKQTELNARDELFDALDRLTKTSAPPIEDLIERSSLGTPEAKAMRALTPDHVVQRVLRRADEIDAALKTSTPPEGSGPAGPLVASDAQPSGAGGFTPRSCVHGLDDCVPCEWLAGFPRELGQSHPRKAVRPE